MGSHAPGTFDSHERVVDLQVFFDRSVTFDYQSVAIERHQRDKRLASEIVVHAFADCRVEGIEQRFTPFQKEHLVQRKGDTVFVDDVGLTFETITL